MAGVSQSDSLAFSSSLASLESHPIAPYGKPLLDAADEYIAKHKRRGRHKKREPEPPKQATRSSHSASIGQRAGMKCIYPAVGLDSEYVDPYQRSLPVGVLSHGHVKLYQLSHPHESERPRTSGRRKATVATGEDQRPATSPPQPTPAPSIAKQRKPSPVVTNQQRKTRSSRSPPPSVAPSAPKRQPKGQSSALPKPQPNPRPSRSPPPSNSPSKLPAVTVEV